MKGLNVRSLSFLDNRTKAAKLGNNPPNRVDWLRIMPFIGLHLACIAVFWVGISVFAVLFAGMLYAVRMFAITGFYHRYFSHRTFKTSRVGQFIFAVLGSSAVQRGPLWWAAHHRDHHRESDTAADVHSPMQHGFLWSHIGWITSKANFPTKDNLVKDLARYPELRFLDRFDTIVPALLAISIFALGALLESVAPGLGTNGWQLLVWGFFVSTVLLYHGTFTINSLAHRFGKQRYNTHDASRNNLWLALITLGEGWHNNHHYYPGSARQGFYWWEIDITWYILKALARIGVIWDLRDVPPHVLDSAHSQSN